MRFLNATNLNTYDETEYFMNKISDLSKKLYQELTANSNIKNTFSKIEAIIHLMTFRLHSGHPTNFFAVGSSSTIMTYF